MAIRTSGVRNHRTGAPMSGADVVTFDNKRLGTVKASANGYFEVDGRWSWRSYWLNSVLIRNCEPGRVTLHVTRESVSRYKLEQPGNSSRHRGGGPERAHNRAERMRKLADGRKTAPQRIDSTHTTHGGPQPGTRVAAHVRRQKLS